MKTIIRVALVSALGLFLHASVQAQAPSCNARCLTDIAQQYMKDVVTKDFSKLPWGDTVRFTENNVAMMIGEGYWGAGPGVMGNGIVLPDPTTGNVVWYGITTEHGQAAYHALRLKVANKAITEVESYFGREGTPDLFAPVTSYRVSEDFTKSLRANERTARDRMTALVDGWFNSRQLNDGKLFTSISDNCVRIVNGKDTTQGDYWAANIAKGCKAQLEQGLHKPADRIRDRRYPVVNEETGLVVAISLEDHAVRYLDYKSTTGADLKVEVPYPNTHGRLELFKIVNGEITRVEGVSTFLPYYIHSLWQH